MQLFKDINTKFDNIVLIKQRKLSLIDNRDKYMIYQREKSENKSNNTSKYQNDKSGSFFDSLVGTITKMGVVIGGVVLAKWLADPKNKDTVSNLFKFGRSLFDTANGVAGFGASSLLDGVSKVASDKSILSKLFGGLIAVSGFVALRWLLNPLKIIKDIKSIPKILKGLTNSVKFLNMSLADLGKWSKSFATGVFKSIDKVFSKGILKVFGKDIWKYLRKSVNSLYKGVGAVAGKITGGAGNLIGKMIPSATIRGFGKFLSKIPIVGSLLGFGINILLGDPVEKAAFKLATAAAGGWLGGAVGALFPPAIPFTSVIGGLLGDWLGDMLFDKFIPPKLALGGVVSHESTSGTHVIVAEAEDEVVIPLSMLKIDNAIGSKFFEPLKIVGSNILGAVQSVINTNGEVYSNISYDINTSLIPLIKTFGISTVVSKSISKSYIKSNKKYLTFDKNNDNILRDKHLTKITQNNNLSNITNNSVRGLLKSILDVIIDSDAISGGKDKMNNITTNTTPIPVVQDVTKNNNSPTKDIPGTLITVGRATSYLPGDGGDPNGDNTSTGEKYSHTVFTAAALPGLINALPLKYTTPVRGKDKHYKQSRTITKPFIVKVVDPATGKQAYIKINNVGQGGKDHRVVDFSTAATKHFGRDIKNVKVFLAPEDAKPGALPSLPKMAIGGEYTYNHLPAARWSSNRPGRKHAGEDMAIPQNGTFQSWIGGTVMYKGFQPGRKMYGHYIDIYNSKLKVTERIAEANNFSVKVGDVVQPGQVVSTGTSTGVIHYEIRKQNKYATQFGNAGTSDPIKYLSSIGAATITTNKIKNNALASLMDGSVKDNIAKTETTIPDVNVTPIDVSKNIGDSLIQLTQMLGLGQQNMNNKLPATKKVSMVDTNLAMIFDGDTNNVSVNNQTVMLKNQSIIQYSRLRMV